jgi:type 1 glutamine amidotransferase
LKALLIIGGCCHDYEKQKDVLKAGLEQRANLIVDVEYSPDKTTKAKFPIYEKTDWAAGYDVVIHDECSADITDPAYVNNILKAHKDGVPSVNLHCAMHCYRWGDFRKPVTAGSENAGWFEMLGLQSTGHGPQEPIEMIFSDAEHPANKGLSNWTTGKEELYNNVAILTAKTLAKGKQVTKNKQGEEKTTEAIVNWTNEYGPKKTRIWSTTLGHNTTTVADERYLDMVTKGLLWACGKLEADGTPSAGYAPTAGVKPSAQP